MVSDPLCEPLVGRNAEEDRGCSVAIIQQENYNCNKLHINCLSKHWFNDNIWPSSLIYQPGFKQSMAAAGRCLSISRYPTTGIGYGWASCCGPTLIGALSSSDPQCRSSTLRHHLLSIFHYWEPLARLRPLLTWVCRCLLPPAASSPPPSSSSCPLRL